MADGEWVPEERDGVPKITGPLTICALLRGYPQVALRHRIEEIKHTCWGVIARMISGSENGDGGEKIMRAMAGIRLAGFENEDDSRRYMLGEIARADPLVDAWLELDPVFTKRRGLPRKTLSEVSGMFDDTEWLWEGWIPRGYMSMIVGRPGAGKSYVAAWLATNALLGGKFPDGTDSQLDRENAEVMWIDTESTHALLVNRLRLMAGPSGRFFWPLDPKDSSQPFPAVDLSKPYWAAIVADMAMDRRPAWIIVDSLRGSHAADENSSEMQAILGTGAAIARDLNCGFTFVHHLRKSAPGETPEVTIDMVRGSTAIVAVARVVIAIDAPDPMSENKRIRVIKSNLTEMPDPIGVSIGAMGPTLLERAPEAPRRVTVVAKAREFLLARLRLGPAPQQELVADAAGMGISTQSLRRAQRELGIVAVKKHGATGHWEWSLPASEGQVP